MMPAKSTQPAKKSNPLVWGIGAIVVVAIVIIAAVVLTQKPSTTSGAQNSANPTVTTSAETYTPPALEEDVTYTARIDVKDYGTITVELDQSAAPITCANFVELAESEELFAHPLHPYTRALLSAIPQPDPIAERKKKLLVYDPAIHHYDADPPAWRELRPRHWVLCSQDEAARWPQDAGPI